jgi:ABC-type branched-subunit amino acid transport system ATPase component/ABC-type branched-subunit amino acid transport system permease subunit
MILALQLALLGLGAGAMYALLAQGIVLIFRGSGVLNLAHGASAMVAAYLYNGLHVNHGWPAAAALTASIAAAAVMGILTDQLLLRRLRRASPLARLIGILGVLIVAQSIGTVLWGATPVIVLPIVTPRPIDLLGATVTTDRLWLLGIACALTAVLTFVWRYTRAGWITAAVAENQRGAAALGWSPELVSALTWAVGSALAGLAGILISPITQLSVPTLVLLVIPALAAALIGRFISFPLTLLGGLIVGVCQAEADNYVHITGASDALPFVLIVIVMVVRGSSLPLRGYVFDRVPEVGIGRVDPRPVALAFASGVVVISLVSSANWLSAITATFATAIVLLSLVVLLGYAGQLSLAQYALAGIGALVAARLVAAQRWPFEVALLAGVLAATVTGVIFALPALRTRGANLAVVSLGLGLAVQAVAFNNGSFTGGPGGTAVGSIRLLGWNIEPTLHPGRYGALVFGLFMACSLVVANIRRSRSGRRLLAIRANERAAAASGINVLAAKVHAFAIAGALAGLGGVLIGFQSTSVTFGGFDPLTSIVAVGQLVIGGAGYVVGALYGALLAPSSVASLIAQHWQEIDQYLPLIGGAGLILTLVTNQNGVVSSSVRLLRPLAGRFFALRPTARPLAPDTRSAARVPPLWLAVENITVRYGGAVAVDGVSLRVDPGELVGLIGPNGAGKTSLIDALTGFAPYSGRVLLGGRSVDSWPAHRRANAGMVRTFQGLELFEGMTVLENLQAAGERVAGFSPVTDLVRPRYGALAPMAAAALREVGLEDFLDRLPSELSLGQRRLVAVARAVAMEPSVLLLDEPVASLDDHESAEFARLVRRLTATWGMAVLIVEHDMDFLMGVSDRVIVLDFGVKIAEGTVAEVRRHPGAVAAYLGEDADEPSDASVGGNPPDPERAP